MRVPFAIATSLIALFTLGSVHSATLIVVDPGGQPTVPDAHADFYPLEIDPIDPGNPIVSIRATLQGAGFRLNALNVNPDGAPTPIRDLALLGAEVDNDTHILFDMSQIASVTDVIETPLMFSATVNFIEGIDALPPGVWPFRSVNMDHGLTDLLWTMTYEDGSTTEYQTGFIPEPATSGLVLVSCLALLCRRNRRVVP